jgi:hypothetical protein
MSGDLTPQQKLEGAKVRVRAKAFANRLRNDNWAEFIPVEDIEWLSIRSDADLILYKDTLKSKGCVQRQDLRWEFKR